MPHLLNPLGKKSWYPLDIRLDGPQKQSRYCEEKNPAFLGIIPVIQPVA
jgi:hypothetical protein